MDLSSFIFFIYMYMLFQHGAGNFAIPHIPEFSFGIHLSPATLTFARKAMSETAMLS